jgi:phosphoglycerate dehydrogenase-like enzyme
MSLATFVSASVIRAQADEAAEELIAKLDLRESEVAVRDLPGWKQPKRIVVLVDNDARLDWLKKTVTDVELISMRQDGPASDMTGVQGLVGSCTPNIVSSAMELHWIHISSAGVERCVSRPEIQGGNYLITNMQRVNSEPIAEHVIAMMLTLTRSLPYYRSLQDEERWKPLPFGDTRMREVQGKTILIVGLGGIGTEVARRADALGMHVIATRNSSRDGPDFVDQVGLADEVLNFAAQADVVVNAAPLTPETTDLFDAEFFSVMRPQSYFFNVGRGKSVVTDDLVAALSDGTLAGAGLDVTEPEPLPPGHSLWQAPNVIITPHVATRTDGGLERYWLVVRENLRRYVAGDKIYSIVDVKRGY